MFDLKKLTVKVIPPATFFQPIVGRKYTLTHSDDTGDFYLNIGHVYYYEAIDLDMRDEVLVQLQMDSCKRKYFSGLAHVDKGQFSKKQSQFRYNIFRKEMGNALQAIFFGDKPFLENYQLLLDAPIYITFESSFPEFHHTLYYGTPREYIGTIRNMLNKVVDLDKPIVSEK